MVLNQIPHPPLALRRLHKALVVQPSFVESSVGWREERIVPGRICCECL